MSILRCSCFGLLLATALAARIFADSPAVTAVLSNSEAAVGETVQLQIKVTGAFVPGGAPTVWRASCSRPSPCSPSRFTRAGRTPSAAARLADESPLPRVDVRAAAFVAGLLLLLSLSVIKGARARSRAH